LGTEIHAHRIQAGHGGYFPVAPVVCYDFGTAAAAIVLWEQSREQQETTDGHLAGQAS